MSVCFDLRRGKTCSGSVYGKTLLSVERWLLFLVLLPLRLGEKLSSDGEMTRRNWKPGGAAQADGERDE